MLANADARAPDLDPATVDQRILAAFRHYAATCDRGALILARRFAIPRERASLLRSALDATGCAWPDDPPTGAETRTLHGHVTVCITPILRPEPIVPVRPAAR
jgi:hypothetical protein